ncbi:hypothetical protein CPLU01_01516 [Colletotrichum plurivorum]|uniref:Uncharacterized protein n=1 Tax=Colletotrichum plurivorum TaxID=2175906 RepID=A0A8H6NP40_9PEZI|nr:hypothetical protein CPLU01_01516 [Colletotrichum plurivorum]
MAKRFFVDWELWQQMTFILACAIAVVFVIGFIKLWWTNRYIAKLEIIDAEKRAHVAEIESTGLPAPRKQSEIPFGVRAIQSGIEVDGIWISRPNTPATDPSPPNSAKGKGKYVAQGPVSPSSTNSDPFSSPASSRGDYGPQTYRPKSISSNNRITSQADALRRLEGETMANATSSTYQPRGGSAPADMDDYGPTHTHRRESSYGPHDRNSQIYGPTDRMSQSYGPTDRISQSSSETYGIHVRVPIRPPPVNRHLNNARGTGSPAGPKAGGVRTYTGNGKKGYSSVPQGSPGQSPAGEFGDPFATPSRSPVNNGPGADHALLPSQQAQQQHVSFAADEYIPSHRHASDGSSASGSSS